MLNNLPATSSSEQRLATVGEIANPVGMSYL